MTANLQMIEGAPSQAAANSLTRVLSGKPMKYTITFLMRDGLRLETQSDGEPALKYNAEFRDVVVVPSTYSSVPLVRWSDVLAMTCEENGGAK